MSYSKYLNAKSTPQSQPIPGKSQVQNSAGGFVYQLDCWKTLERFLILGSEGGTYYASEKALTLKNAKTALECIKKDGIRTVKMVTEISDQGRALKNNTATFVLALALSNGNEETRKAAYEAIPVVCRTGTHLFTFVNDCENLGKGWGRGMKRAIANWYLTRNPGNLAHQLVKYQGRVTEEGKASSKWTNRDLLRLAHPKTTDPTMNALFKWAVKGYESGMIVPGIVTGFEKAKNAQSVAEIVELIETYNLPREAIPTKFLNDKAVWSAMLSNMPLTALIRNLGKMTSIGLLSPSSKELDIVLAKLGDKDYIKKSRVHPMTILIALKTYQSNRGFRGDLTWNAVGAIVSALDKAFYLAFDNVESTGRKFLIGLDVSGSMGATIGNTFLQCREAAAALAMVTLRTEPKCYTYGFTSGRGRSMWSDYGTALTDLALHDRMSLNEALTKTSSLSFGGTDCALPMIKALEEGMFVDVFIVITDNETWAGNIHPSQALKEYRKKINPNAKLIVIGMTSTNFSIADPTDAGMLDVVGFDPSVPTAITEFIKM